MSLTLYFFSPSTSSVTTDVLAELEHTLSTTLAKRVRLDIKAGESRTPHYLSTVNPNGHVPAIVHDGVSIWESSAITMYLGETFGVDCGLYPALGPRRGEAMKWIVWSSTTVALLAPKLMALAGMAKDGTAEQEKEKETTMASAAKVLGVLDGALEGKEFLLGEKYCLADTHLHCFVGYWAVMGTDLSTFKNLNAWLGRVAARPALRESFLKSVTVVDKSGDE